jgi:hypothetical protein
MDPTPAEMANVTRAVKSLRAAPARWEPVITGGHTPAKRWVVTLNDGRTVFAKVAADELTASWLRDEHLVYSVLRGSPFMPGYVGWYDDGSRPVMALEDMSGAAWPPPWDRSKIDAVLACVDAVATTPPPDGLPKTDDTHLELREGWDEVGRDLTAVLGLGVCGPEWLKAHLLTLREAAHAAPLAGEALLHLDVRSDNVCFRPDGRAALVDWNWTSIGNPEIDTAFWLPSLEAEGGPPPEEVAPDVSPELVACWAGYLVSHAAREPIPTAPHVRGVQLRQARSALPWAARRLGLAPPA